MPSSTTATPSSAPGIMAMTSAFRLALSIFFAVCTVSFTVRSYSVNCPFLDHTYTDRGLCLCRERGGGRGVHRTHAPSATALGWGGDFPAMRRMAGAPLAPSTSPS